jgi:hypothetical protein
MNTGDAVEAGIKRGDPLDAVIEHDGRVQRIASRDAGAVHQKIARAVRVRERYVENDRTGDDEEVVDLTYEVEPVDSGVTVRLGCSRPAKYIGILESMKTITGVRLRSRRASARYLRLAR